MRRLLSAAGDWLEAAVSAAWNPAGHEVHGDEDGRGENDNDADAVRFAIRLGFLGIVHDYCLGGGQKQRASVPETADFASVSAQPPSPAVCFYG